MSACAVSASMWWLPMLAVIVALIVGAYFGHEAKR